MGFLLHSVEGSTILTVCTFSRNGLRLTIGRVSCRSREPQDCDLQSHARTDSPAGVLMSTSPVSSFGLSVIGTVLSSILHAT